MRIERGCEKDSPIPDKWVIGSIILQRCPKKALTSSVSEYIIAYNFLTHGLLPNAGGWLDQSVKFIEAMQLIEAELAKTNDKNAKTRT